MLFCVLRVVLYELNVLVIRSDSWSCVLVFTIRPTSYYTRLLICRNGSRKRIYHCTTFIYTSGYSTTTTTNMYVCVGDIHYLVIYELVLLLTLLKLLFWKHKSLMYFDFFPFTQRSGLVEESYTFLIDFFFLMLTYLITCKVFFKFIFTELVSLSFLFF